MKSHENPNRMKGNDLAVRIVELQYSRQLQVWNLMGNPARRKACGMPVTIWPTCDRNGSKRTAALYGVSCLGKGPVDRVKIPATILTTCPILSRVVRMAPAGKIPPALG
jgi:hypothetical protein